MPFVSWSDADVRQEIGAHEDANVSVQTYHAQNYVYVKEIVNVNRWSQFYLAHVHLDNNANDKDCVKWHWQYDENDGMMLAMT